ncbi:SAM-dependent methyltransferase [Variovorax sp. TBS-050B]|uniref:class I SAM-dependent methyltransferase n=1 Tax=Variovorax sp. TBS-050B TaxID=2940551 RepID=UPI0024761498|nr:class I SAM-dependent methyltransferase [Variovorax sp. TBS-050B]MDH6592660.1 SAM-dependent methyltransferase [Variovorax sp. TBS-050B]
MIERLHFNTGMAYESMLAAEHLSRYRLLSEACKGKRVLDVACGEGYGSSLLKKWGADSVVGVDISQDAITVANEHFANSGITFRTGDACNLDRLLSGEEPFDLIVSFETIEHVRDVSSLLRSIRDRLALGGMIVISCPNDSGVAGGERNEFHLKTYTFAEFRHATTGVLGDAAQWLLGMPVIGFGICDASDRWAQRAGTHLSTLVEGSDAVASQFLPAQLGHEVDFEKASFYVGVWGAPLPRVLIAAPISHRAYVRPWASWLAAKAENKRLQNELAQHGAKHSVEQQSGTENAVLPAVGFDAEGREIQRLRSEIHLYKAQITFERNARLLLASKLHERSTDSRSRLERFEQESEELRAAQAMNACILTERNALNDRLHAMTSSRGYRMVERYYFLYEHGATRWFMRPARRLASAIWRALKPRRRG